MRLNFYDQWEDNNKAVYAQSTNLFADKVTTIISILNHFDFLFDKYQLQYMVGLSPRVPNDIALTSIRKSLNNIAVCLHLTLTGNYGSARIILRNIVEFLVIGKYLCLTDDQDALKRWDNTIYINLDRKVLNRLTYPTDQKLAAFRKWWQCLCNWNHATSASGQLDITFTDIAETLQSISIVLFMVMHFTNHYLTTNYFKKYYDSLPSFGNQKRILIRDIESTIKDDLNTIYASLNFEQKQLITFYRSTWTFTSTSTIKNTDNHQQT